ncbi:hypothetical protein O181_071017 [Austropuccinia psidii MF-1]|uniref:Uncharacterized protein n=1 Tax=Austropuccinia psidii MF-1 TaxID=1389203 RepID=A0A9Q3F704_9BASI|nr:hypothetical protein [Austropuccinia psidii MF-1]
MIYLDRGPFDDLDSSHWDPSNEESASSSDSKESLVDAEKIQNNMLVGFIGKDEDAFTQTNVHQGINKLDDENQKGGESLRRSCQSTTSTTDSMKHKSLFSSVSSLRKHLKSS